MAKKTLAAKKPLTEDEQDAADDHAELLESLKFHLCGTVVNATVDGDPGVVLTFMDGRVVRVVANTQFAMVVPYTNGTIH